MGVETSVSKYVAECQRVIEKSGLKYKVSTASHCAVTGELN